MDAKTQRRRAVTLASLNVSIEAMNLAKEIASITPAKAVFGSVSVILAMIRVSFSSSLSSAAGQCVQDSMMNRADYVDLGLACADVCKALDRGIKGRRVDEFSQSVLDAIEQLTAWVQPAMQIVYNSLTMFSITGLRRRSRERSSSRADEMRPLSFSTRRMIKIRLPPGGWTSIGSSTSLMCVPLFLYGYL
jgi:hypothetical protein